MHKYTKTYLLLCDQMLNNDISHIFAIGISLPVQPMNRAEKIGFMLKIYFASCAEYRTKISLDLKYIFYLNTNW